MDPGCGYSMIEERPNKPIIIRSMEGSGTAGAHPFSTYADLCRPMHAYAISFHSNGLQWAKKDGVSKIHHYSLSMTIRAACIADSTDFHPF